jgi:hypothetical protein
MQQQQVAKICLADAWVADYAEVGRDGVFNDGKGRQLAELGSSTEICNIKLCEISFVAYVEELLIDFVV